MKLKHLQSALSSVPTPQFVQPNITLEQYATSPELTSYIIFAALAKNDIGYGKTVLDLGCGTGMLSIGSAIVGTSHLILVDCDEDAMAIARENIEAMGIGEFHSNSTYGSRGDTDDVFENNGDEYDDYIHEQQQQEEEDKEDEDACRIEYILAKVKHVPSFTTNHNEPSRGGTKKRHGGNHTTSRAGRNNNTRTTSKNRILQSPNDIGPMDDGIPLTSKCVDTVITNPPFGTKPGNAGIDITFLRSAIRLATGAVYSFHKSSTRDYLIKTVEGWGYHVSVVAEMKFDIPKLYKFHSKDNVDVYVDLIRVDIAASGACTDTI